MGPQGPLTPGTLFLWDLAPSTHIELERISTMNGTVECVVATIPKSGTRN